MAKPKRKNTNLKIGIIIGLVIGLILIGFEVYIITKTDVEPEVSVFVEPEPEVVIEPEPEIELPFGGRQVLPDYTFVALYGSPLHKTLGSLGEQPLAETITRAKSLAAEYQVHTEKTVIPTLEIITTIASAELTSNDDYSRETEIDKLRDMVEAAKQANLYVLLDLQPGRSTFLSQAMQYEELLLEPHVGLALDPEWRLQSPTDRHLVKVGSVEAAEVNETSQWLAELVTDNELPQKLFMIHQFKPSMIMSRELLKADYPELGYVIHMDGFGTLDNKQDTYKRIIIDTALPSGAYPGWKNFYDEDLPTLTPEQTMSQTPQPVYISYQ